LGNLADIQIKENAIGLLEKELKSKRVKGTIGFGSMNDCYQPIEIKEKLTRRALEVINKYKYPIHIMTKSDLVLRDLDIIKNISKTYAAVTFTITTADDKLARIIEPGASAPSKRFEALKILSDNSIYCGISLMPILPFIEDTEENITQIVEQAYNAGVKYFIPFFGMTLRKGQREYYYKKLDEHFPGFKQKYIQVYGGNYEAVSPKTDELTILLYSLCKEKNIATKITSFTPEQIGML
jgi:DNA repair photolyase